MASTREDGGEGSCLASRREQEEVLTAAEAEMARPWKEAPLRGKPGAGAVLRDWEDLDAEDHPGAVWWLTETARLWSILLVAIERPLLGPG